MRWTQQELDASELKRLTAVYNKPEYFQVSLQNEEKESDKPQHMTFGMSEEHLGRPAYFIKLEFADSAVGPQVIDSIINSGVICKPMYPKDSNGLTLLVLFDPAKRDELATDDFQDALIVLNEHGLAPQTLTDLNAITGNGILLYAKEFHQALERLQAKVTSSADAKVGELAAKALSATLGTAVSSAPPSAAAHDADQPAAAAPSTTLHK